MFEEFNKKANRRGTDCIKWDYQAKDGQLPFAVADSDYPAPKVVIDAIIKRAQHGYFGYTRLGDDYLDAIRGWYKKSHNVEITNEMILPVSGVLVAIRIALEHLGVDSKSVIIQSPVYSHFFVQLEEMRREIIENELINKDERYTMDLKDLEEKFKAGHKVLLLCNPHNPVGRVWTYQELENLSKLCKKYDVSVVSDEIHSDLILPGHKFTSMLEFKDYFRHLYVASAPTKTFNLAGLLTAYLIVPNKDDKVACRKIFVESQLAGVNILAAAATKAAYTEDSAFTWVKEQQKFLKSNYLYVKETIEKELPMMKVAPLEGTYLMWLDARAFGMDGETLNKLLLDGGVAINTGAIYGKKYDQYIRINIACPHEQLVQGMNMFIGTLKKRVE